MTVRVGYGFHWYFLIGAIHIYSSYAVNKSEEEELAPYLDELNKSIIQQQIRKQEALEKENKILETIFHKSLDTYIEYQENILLYQYQLFFYTDSEYIYWIGFIN